MVYRGEPGSTFSNAAPGGDVPVANLEDFTMGLLIRINGGLIQEEHHLVGLQANPREAVQNMRIWLDTNGGGFDNVSIAQGAIGARGRLSGRSDANVVRAKQVALGASGV